MRRRAGLAVAAIWMSLTAVTAAQTDGQKPPKDDKAEKKAPAPLTLTGCVEREAGSNQLTIDDQAGGKYRVSGNRIERFVGQRVEVVGNLDSARLRVKGGLYPSPNAAGQAGAMDPVKSAMAAQPGGPASGTGAVDLPQLRVRSVKTLSGSCR